MIISGVETITRDEIAVQKLTPETDDGQIYDLESLIRKVNLTIHWDTYQPRSHITRFYVLSGTNISMDVVLGKPMEPSGPT